MWLVVPVPYRHTHELVLYSRDGAGLTSWKQLVFLGTKQQVHQSIAELMRRAPWALFGFGEEERLAMSVGQRVETTRAIEARRVRAMAEGMRLAYPIHDAAAGRLEAERIRVFPGRTRD